MAIEFISDEVVTNSSDASSVTITVPADCTLLVFGATAWDNDDIFPGTTTVNSVSLTTLQSHIADAQNKATIKYLVSPSTGSQTLAWDWVGTDALTEGMVMFCTYFKGVDTGSPVVASGSSLGTTDVTGMGSPASGDMMVGFSSSFDTAVTVTGSSQTSLSTPARFNNNFGRGAYKLATSTYDISGGDSANAHVAAVFRATAGTTLSPPLLTNNQAFFTETLRFTMHPALHTNVQSFFAETLLFTVHPELFTNNQTFFTPTVTTPTFLSPPLLINTQLFFSAILTVTGVWTPIDDSSPNIWGLINDSSPNSWLPINDTSANNWVEI